MDFIQACRKIISIDSSPSAGNFFLAQWLAQWAQDKGFLVELQDDHSNELPQSNVLIRPPTYRLNGRKENGTKENGCKENEREEFLFQNHLDTIDPGPFALWSDTEFNPFDAHIKNGFIYGLGAAEVKLDILCKIEALSKFDLNTLWKTSPLILGTWGEETGMNGAIKFIRKNRIHSKRALIGEPTGLRLFTASNGYVHIEIRIPYEIDELQFKQDHNLQESTSTQIKMFHGKPAHSSTPHLGDSAISKMLIYLSQLPNNVVIMEMEGGINHNSVPAQAHLELDIATHLQNPMTKKILFLSQFLQDLEHEFHQYQDDRFKPSHPTLNLGCIRTYEDHIFLSGTCRLLPKISTELSNQWMHRLEDACRKQSGELRIVDFKKPFESLPHSEYIQNAKSIITDLNMPSEIGTLSSTNEASLFARRGIECLIFGPGEREGNIHTPMEKVSIAELNKAIEFYSSCLERFCL